MNSLLQQIDRWLQLNKLSLNIFRIHYKLFTRSNFNTNDICIRNVHLERVYQTKFLRIIVGNRLSLKVHAIVEFFRRINSRKLEKTGQSYPYLTLSA